MTPGRSDRVSANFASKIKKWLKAVKQLRNSDVVFPLPITRLTSVKSLCQDEKAARSFALHISQRVLQQIYDFYLLDDSELAEWQTYQAFVVEISKAIATEENVAVLQQYLTKIAEYQGLDRRKIHWTKVYFVQREYLQKLEYALRCCTESDRGIWGYRLAREYVECYSPIYGTGLIPDSIPFLLDIAEFWCQYYFDLSLHEKFAKIVAQIEGISLHECLTSYQGMEKNKQIPSNIASPFGL